MSESRIAQNYRETKPVELLAHSLVSVDFLPLNNHASVRWQHESDRVVAGLQ